MLRQRCGELNRPLSLLQRCSPPSLLLSLSPGLGPDGLPSPGGYHAALGPDFAVDFRAGGANAGAAVAGGGRRSRGSPAVCASELINQLAMRTSTGKERS
jgi:hypothetical protein